MSVNYFVHQETVATNMIFLMRERGFSRLSLSKLADVNRTAVEQLLNGWNGEVLEYNTLIERIRLKFELPIDYFLKDVTLLQSSETQLSPEVQELRDGLDNVLDIYSMYLD